MEKRTERLNTRVLPSIKAMAEQMAASDGRTLSNYIENLILNDYKERGIKMKKYHIEYATPEMIKDRGGIGLHDLSWGDIVDGIEAESEEEAIELAKQSLIDDGYDENIEDVIFRVKSIDKTYVY